MTEALQAEWSKLRSLPGARWLIVGAICVTVLASAALAAATHVSQGSAGGGLDPTRLALAGIDLGQAVIAVIAVLSISDEYSTGMIAVTIAAIPRRMVMLGAKATNVAGLTLIVAVPAVAGCLVAGRVLLPGAGLDPAHGYALVSIANGATLRAAVGTLLYLALIALLSLGIGTIVRDTAVSTGTVLGLLYLPPLLAQLVSDPWRRHIRQLAPMTAGLAIQATRNLRSLPNSPWTGLGILAVWTAGTLLVAVAVLDARDA